MPLDQMIGQRFVHDITTDSNDPVIVQTIIVMMEAMGLNVIAEGIETKKQKEFLKRAATIDFKTTILPSQPP